MEKGDTTENVCDFDWNNFAEDLKNEFGSCLVDDELGVDDVYNWWLVDVTVSDIVDFCKKYKK